MMGNGGQKFRKILKICALSLLGVFALYESSYLIWKNSGLNEWQLASDENGLKLWTLKTPGSDLLKVKGEVRVKARLASIVAILEETEIQDKKVGIGKVTVLEQKDTPSFFITYHHYVHDLSVLTGLPFTPREFILLEHRSQDPITKKIELNLLAAPNKLPPSLGTVRVSHLNNIWTLTPLPSGEVEVQMAVDVDLGGDVPYFYNNLMMLGVVKEFCTSIRKLSTGEKYANAKVAYVTEPGGGD